MSSFVKLYNKYQPDPQLKTHKILSRQSLFWVQVKSKGFSSVAYWYTLCDVKGIMRDVAEAFVYQWLIDISS